MYSSTTITAQGRAGWSVAIAGVAAEERVGARNGVEAGLELADEIPGGQPAQQLFVFVGQAGVTGPASPAALLNQFLADAHAVSLPQGSIGSLAVRWSTGGLAIADGQRVGVGDEVITRANNRLLVTGRRCVKNGDRWSVTVTNEDGSMAVRRAGGTGDVVLPAAAHVELAYATTAHRAQGRTVDTAHAMVSPTTTREVLYVAATRGRESNRVYVDTSYDPDPQTSHDGMTDPQTAAEVLAGFLANEGADISAHATIRRAQHQAEDFTVLASEYQTLARAAQADRWDSLLERSGLVAEQLEQVRATETYGPLLAALRDAEARGLDVEATFPKLVTARPLTDADDPAAVLHGRVDRWLTAAGSRRQAATNLIARLIPRALGATHPDMARALSSRDKVMQRRAAELATQAVERDPVWIRRLGSPPADPAARDA